MNRIYRSIWNQATGAYAAVSENVNTAGKRSMPGASGAGARFALTSMAAALMLGYGSLALAGPTGGIVVAGQAQLGGTPGTTVINQASQNAVINWSTFNIGQGESVQFVQPNSNAVALNRVLGNDATTILGKLSANGKVFIVNPNGILFGQGSSVNTAGLVASTLDISNADFMAGRYIFSGTGAGKVLNQGDLAAPGGYVALLGAQVSNEGTITARLGTVALAAGQSITLDVAGDGLLNVAVERGAVGALVQNGGLVQADGGTVVLTAQAAGNLLKTVVNNTGVIEAHSIDTRGGTIKLLGDMQSGTVNAGGKLDASAPAGTGGDGGFIETSAAHVKLADDLIVNTAAARGMTGTWLIDPTDFTIAPTGGDQTGAFYTNALKTSNVTIQTVATGTGAGDINVNDNIVWNANKLTLTASNNININRALRGAGTASLALEYGQANVAAGNASTYNVKAEVDLPSGQNFSTRLGSNGVAKVYTVINSLGAPGSTTGTDLQGMSLTGSYVLGSNLDISATSSWNGNSGFMPIGTTGTPFTGTFDGLGHELHGLTINRGDMPVGLFGTIGTGGAVRNLGLVNVNVAGGAMSYGTYADIGALAGNNSGKIDNVYSSGQVGGSAYSNVGGLVGTNSGTISNSHTGGAMSSASFAAVGGLVAINAAGGLVTNSYSTTAVTASNAAAAGLVGDNRGVISNSYATGIINSGSNYGAGLVSFSSGSIINSHATGNVSGGPGLGGLVGYLDSAGTIDNSYATGMVAGYASNVGGLVGLSRGVIRNSYATGDVSGTALVGGVVGYNLGSMTNVYFSGKNNGTATPGGIAGDQVSGTIVNAFFNKDLNPGMTGVGRTFNSSTSNAVALTTAQMLVPANYTGFNFTSTAGATGNNWVQVSSGSTLNGGDGTRPMLASEWSSTINSVHALQLIAMNKSASYTLGSSFSAAATAGSKDVWGSAGFIPVGSIMAGSFTGSLDGTGHTISGLNIAATQDFAGLFGIVSLTGRISNVGLTGATVSGASNLGILAGHNAGKISGSFATGTVTGTGTVGGLVGTNPGTVSDSYASSTVNGATAGGLVGNSNGSIVNSYANGAVSASGTAGGLVAANTGTVTGSFWDTTTSGRTTSAGGTGLTSAQLTNLANYTGANWELGQMWVVYDGQSAPFLRAFMQPIAVRVSYDTKVYDGTAYAGGASTTTLSNVVAGNVLPGTPVFTGSAAGAIDAGTYGVSVSGYYATGGQAAYAISYIDGGLVITPRLLTLTGATAGNKVYDGTTAAIIGGGSLSGVLARDSGNVTLGSLTGAYATKNVGNAIAVNATATITGSAGGNYALAPLTGVTGNITPATISSIDGIVASGKTYDGTTSAALSTAAAVFNGKIGSDVLSVTGTATFADKNAGTGKTISISGLALGGADAANYILQSTTASGTGSILARALTLTGVSGINRVYDGTTTAGITGGTLSGFVGSESVSLAGLNGTFASKNVGTAKAITVSGATLIDGTNGGLASNYTVATPAGLSANVTQATISSIGNLAALDKVYDGNTSATLNGAGAVFNGMVAGDSLAASGTASFADKNAGSGKTVAVTGVTLGGADAANYTLASTTASATGNITPKALTITGMAAVNKVYNGNTNADLAGGAISGLVGVETLGVTGLTASFADQNAGIGKTVTATGATLVNGNNGGLAANYTISNPTGLSASITPKVLTVSGMTAATRAYDGTTAASLSGGTLSGLVGSETLVLAGGSGAFADKNAGNGKTVTVSSLTLANGSGRASNYTVARPTGVTGSITQKVLNVTGALAQDKTYDGTTAATITGGTLSGLVGTETVALSSLAGTFADQNAGTAKAVNLSGGTLANGSNGGLAANYTVGPSTGLSASIAQKALTVTGVTAASKVYDGSTSATLSGGTLSGLVGSETLSLAGLTGAFADKNAGAGKGVTVNGATLGNGTGLASNYTVANPGGVTANITQATIGSISNLAALDKVYDGNTSATLNGAGAVFNGMVAGDSLAASGTASFADKNAGAGKTVVVTGVTLGGADAANYTLASTTASATGNITPKALTITGMAAVNKVYNGNTNAALAGGAISGLVGAETVGVTGLTASFADQNAGIGKTVTATGATLVNGNNGGLAANYTISNPTGLSASITPKVLTVAGMTAATRAYDGTTAASLSGGTLSGLVGSETLVLAGGSGAFADKNAGNGKTVTVSNLTLANGSGLASNYTVASPTGVTGSITQKVLNVTGALAQDKTYDGSTTATITGGTLTGLVGTETVALSSLTGTFADQNAGNGKAVNLSGGTLANGSNGGLAANYTVGPVTGLSASIAQKALTVTGVTAASKVYDGSTSATLSGGTLSGLVGSETLSLAGLTGAFADKNAGAGKAVTVNGATLGNGTGLASNYTVANPVGVTANITQATIGSISNLAALDKVYDGNTSATLNGTGAVFNGMVAGDSLAASGTASFANKNAGSGKTVAVTGVTLGGADAANYTLASTTASATGNITPKALTITGMAAVNKVYNGNTNAALAGGTISGLVGAETLGVTGLTASFADQNAGIGKTVTATGATLVNGNNGGLAANYTISNPTGLSASITPKALTVAGMTAATRAYDGTTAASLSGGTLSGLVGSETLVLAGGSGAFADKNAGNGKTVTVSNLTLADGSGLASNYTVASPTGVTGSITQKVLTLAGALAQDKTYDGTTAAAITGGTLSGLVGTETVALSSLTGTFADQNAGTAKAVNLSGGTLANGSNGGLAANYTVGPSTGLSASIAQKALTVTGVTAASKVYDGSTSATLSGGTLSGLVGSETLSFAGLTGAFADKNAGAGKAVTVNGATLGNGTGLASNYTVANPGGVTANITPASLVVSATAANRAYDATTNASVKLSDNRIGGDILSISSTGASFSSKDAGVNKTVTVAGIAIGGSDAGNYVADATATTTATITQAALAVRVANAEKDQGRANPAFTASYAGLLGADTVAGEVAGTLAFVTDATTGSAAGSYLVSAGGQTAANYALTYTPGVLTVKPTTALQSAVSSVIGTVAMAPSQGNMVQGDMASMIAATGDAVTARAETAGATFATAPAGTAPVVQAGPSINTNVLPGLRLSVIDTGLRLPAGTEENTSVEIR